MNKTADPNLNMAINADNNRRTLRRIQESSLEHQLPLAIMGLSQAGMSYSDYQKGRTGEALGRTAGQLLGAGLAIATRKGREARIRRNSMGVSGGQVSNVITDENTTATLGAAALGGMIGSSLGKSYDSTREATPVGSKVKIRNVRAAVARSGVDPDSIEGKKIVAKVYRARGGTLKLASMRRVMDMSAGDKVLGVGVALSMANSAGNAYNLIITPKEKAEKFREIERSSYKKMNLIKDEKELDEFAKWKAAKADLHWDGYGMLLGGVFLPPVNNVPLKERGRRLAASYIGTKMIGHGIDGRVEQQIKDIYYKRMYK